MNIRKVTVKNSFYAMLAQLVMLLMRFLSRFFLLKYVGVEKVGISDTILSIVGALSLSEFGIGSAISYSLYTPIYNNDYETVNKIMNVFQKLYSILSGIIFTVGIIGSFFLQYFLKGITLNGMVYLMYYLYVCNTCVSYLLCHRRTLLYADLREYVVKRVDIITNLAFSFVSIVVIYITHNIALYILTVLLQTFVSNIWIHVKCKKLYPYLEGGRIDKAIVRNTLMYAKNLFAGSVAAFVYGSTDNLIVSVVTGTVLVGYFNNYVMVSKSVYTIISQVLMPITPTIGRLQRGYSSKNEFFRTFLKYHQICYTFAFLVTVPTLVLFDGFIEFIFGPDYLLMPAIKCLLSIVLYVNIAAFSYGTVLTTSGEFRLIRRVETAGAVINIVSSIFLVHLMGLPGVLAGTVITVAVQWIMRSHMVYTNCFALNNRVWVVSIFKELYKILLVVIAYICGQWFYNFMNTSFLIRFVVCGCFCVVVSGLIYICLYRANDKITIKDILYKKEKK